MQVLPLAPLALKHNFDQIKKKYLYFKYFIKIILPQKWQVLQDSGVGFPDQSGYNPSYPQLQFTQFLHLFTFLYRFIVLIKTACFGL